eukprot:3083774-Pyramimonas_sp.AAC.1
MLSARRGNGIREIGATRWGDGTGASHEREEREEDLTAGCIARFLKAELRGTHCLVLLHGRVNSRRGDAHPNGQPSKHSTTEQGNRAAEPLSLTPSQPGG